VVEATQEIILRYTPPGDPAHGPWRYAHGTGVYPQWLADLQSAGFIGIETFSFDVQVSYSHEAWVGRIRASAPMAQARWMTTACAPAHASWPQCSRSALPRTRSRSPTAYGQSPRGR